MVLPDHLRLTATLLAGAAAGAVGALAWVSARAEPRELGALLDTVDVAPAIDANAEPVDREREKRATPLEPDAAASLLARAWKDVLGDTPSAEALGVLWAHWALETGRGRWMVDHNFAGLRGRAPGGGSALWSTWEQTERGPRRVQKRFRAYETPSDGAKDYVKTLARRYPDALEAARRGDAEEFIGALERRGYFSKDADAYGRAAGNLAREFHTSGLGDPFGDT